MKSRRLFVVAISLALVGAAVWTWSARPAAADGDFDGVQFTSMPNGIAFFDTRTGDVWMHAFQPGAAPQVTHMKLSGRGEKLYAATAGAK